MEQNAQQLQQNQLGPAQRGQQNLRQQMARLAERMQRMAEETAGMQQQVNVNALRRALEDVLTLSQEQERVADEVEALPARSPALRAHARQQVELAQGLSATADTLRSLARSVPQLSAAVTARAEDGLREMTMATERLAEGDAGPASGHQKTAMAHLNDLALLLSDLLDQQQNPSGGDGEGMPRPQMQQGLQQMQGQQQQLNEAIQQLLNETAGERLSRSQQERAAQLAAQQDAIRRQLEELAREGADHLDPRTRSAIRRAIEAMDRTARDLRMGRLTPETLARQTEILQRLLEAEESANQRGREERREGRTATPVPNPGRPPSLPPLDGPADRLRRDLLRALDAGYAPDYEDLIRRYFDRLRGRAGS
jgi:hypothetical protein